MNYIFLKIKTFIYYVVSKIVKIIHGNKFNFHIIIFSTSISTSKSSSKFPKNPSSFDLHLSNPEIIAENPLNNLAFS